MKHWRKIASERDTIFYASRHVCIKCEVIPIMPSCFAFASAKSGLCKILLKTPAIYAPFLVCAELVSISCAMDATHRPVDYRAHVLMPKSMDAKLASEGALFAKKIRLFHSHWSVDVNETKVSGMVVYFVIQTSNSCLYIQGRYNAVGGKGPAWKFQRPSVLCVWICRVHRECRPLSACSAVLRQPCSEADTRFLGTWIWGHTVPDISMFEKEIVAQCRRLLEVTYMDTANSNLQSIRTGANKQCSATLE